MTYEVKVGDVVFLKDGGRSIGSVHQVLETDHSKLSIYVENAGDFKVPTSAIKSAHFGKVILDEAKLDEKMRISIQRMHNAETAD